MPFLVALLVIALIIAFLFLSTLFIVPQQQAYIIERFGKFNKVQFAGIHIRIPFVDRIAMKTNMRVNQLNVQSGKLGKSGSGIMRTTEKEIY